MRMQVRVANSRCSGRCSEMAEEEGSAYHVMHAPLRFLFRTSLMGEAASGLGLSTLAHLPLSPRYRPR
jgi:hypothetical protein